MRTRIFIPSRSTSGILEKEGSTSDPQEKVTKTKRLPFTLRQRSGAAKVVPVTFVDQDEPKMFRLLCTCPLIA